MRRQPDRRASRWADAPGGNQAPKQTGARLRSALGRRPLTLQVNPEKVVHLISTADVGGAQVQLAGILARLKTGTNRHCVVCMTEIGPIGETIRQLGVPVYSLGMKRTVPSLRAIWDLWRLLRRERPAILQTWLYHADLLGLLVGKAAGVPVLVWNVRCSALEMRHYPRLTGIVFRILARLSHLPTAVVANSLAGRAAHLKAGYHPRRFEVIPNGFELDTFHPDPTARTWLESELGIPRGHSIVGLVARYDPMKGHGVFLAAAEKVLARHPETRFVLCGERVSQDNPALTAAVRDYGLQHAVHLLGLRRDVAKITAGFDVACSSSLFGEGFQNTVGEAMACGVPCVVTDVGDSADIVETSGVVVPPGDANALAEALIAVLELGAERRITQGRQARARIIQAFDMTTIAGQYQTLYESLRSVACDQPSQALKTPPQAIGGRIQGNMDCEVVRGFGDEWTRFDQQGLADADLRPMFDEYFHIFPWESLPPGAEGYDVGCGTGRWARFVAPRVARLHCIDPSAPALAIAQRSLRHHANCVFHLASVDDMPLSDGSMDFGYALGVLHHLPDTQAGIQSCVAKLKPGAPLLLYLYYAFDNRPRWFRYTWHVTNMFRQGISRLPFAFRYWLSQFIAAAVYYPLARLALLWERAGLPNVTLIPLSWYRRRSFYTMRTDALDRFGTQLEGRFSAEDIARMMEQAGLERISFSQSMPYWCAVGYKKPYVEQGRI